MGAEPGLFRLCLFDTLIVFYPTVQNNNILKTGVLLVLTVFPPPPKKGGPCRPAKLQYQNPRKLVKSRKYLILFNFFPGVDTISHLQKNTNVRLPE